MLAFAKVPLAALATHALPVLFDLREEVFVTESRPGDAEGTPETFRDKAMAILKRSEVEVLSWKADQTHINMLEDLFLNDGYCDAHWAKQEFGSVDVLAGRFLQASPEKLAEKAPLRSLVPDGLFRQERYLTVTKGCGCRMGHLGNPYRAAAPENVAKWWMGIEDDPSMYQLRRCRWRYDVWFSPEPLVDVGNGDSVPLDRVPDDDVDLGCTISITSKKLLEPVEDLSQLVLMPGFDLGTHTGWQWEHNDRFGVGSQFPGSKLLYNSQEAKVGPAGPPQGIDDDGCSFVFPFQIWRKPRATSQSNARVVDKAHDAGHAMVTDFQKNLGSVLCSTRCAFSDLQSVPQALGRLLSLSSPPAPLPRFVPHQRGTSNPCDHVQKMFMPQGFPTDLASFMRSGLGPLTTNEEIATSARGRGSSARFFGKIERIYAEECDFEATLLLDPAQCEEGHVPDLRLSSSGVVEETCLPRAVGGTTAAPPHRYAVAWDLSYHDRNSLREEEIEVENGLIEAGFSRWGRDMVLESPKLNTDIWYWSRSLRQRIFVQRDPRVTTASGADVCGE